MVGLQRHRVRLVSDHFPFAVVTEVLNPAKLSTLMDIAAHVAVFAVRKFVHVEPLRHNGNADSKRFFKNRIL